MVKIHSSVIVTADGTCTHICVYMYILTTGIEIVRYFTYSRWTL